MRIIAFCQKLNKNIWPNLEHLPVLNALCGDDPEQNAGTTLASNPEHLPVFKAPSGGNLEQNAGTIHTSNPEQLLVFKALRRDHLEQNVGPIHVSNPEHLVFKAPRKGPFLEGISTPWVCAQDSRRHPFVLDPMTDKMTAAILNL